MKIMTDRLLRKGLMHYRYVQYKLCKRQPMGLFHLGRPCSIEPFKFEINKGDVVHPCVRYIAEGFEGHKWWMVYTPYYRGDASMENPILCYANSNEEMPPSEWNIYCEIQPGSKVGYNSDPTLLYVDEKLYVLWRENDTRRVLDKQLHRAVFGCQVCNQKTIAQFGPIVETNDSEYDKETCPTFLYNANKGEYTCYAMDLRFHSKFIKSLPNCIRALFSKVALVSDLLGIWSPQKSYGVAVWKSDSIKSHFQYIKTSKFKRCNKLYRPWHMDFFQHDGVNYAIVQTNQCNADLCLAKSIGNDEFEFFKKPLITNESIDKVGIYKPTAGVINGLFYIYYTAQDKTNRNLNKLYLSTMPFEELIAKIS